MGCGKHEDLEFQECREDGAMSDVKMKLAATS
jgi:hypothetical protein